jgi:anti-sigma factor RsiW
MSATGPPPPPSPEPAGVEAAPERSAARNPWLWATAGVAVLAIAFGIWGLHERSNASDAKADLHAQEKPAAKQAQAEKRQLGAKARAAAACAKSMLEIVGEIPKAGSVDDGLNQAADQVTALVPKCKDSVASAGG